MGTCIGSQKHDIKIIQRRQLESAIYETTDEPTYDFTEGKVIRVYDGDTLTLAVFDNGRLVRYNVRIYGVDCAEIKGGTDATKKKAYEAKKFVEDAILNKIVEVRVLNNRMVDDIKIKEKYGRLLAEIYYNGNNLANELLKNGHAVPYYGGKKEQNE
jgi:hypothetical protein